MNLFITTHCDGNYEKFIFIDLWDYVNQLCNCTIDGSVSNMINVLFCFCSANYISGLFQYKYLMSF